MGTYRESFTIKKTEVCSLLCSLPSFTSLFIVFNLSSPSSIRLASMKWLYLSVGTDNGWLTNYKWYSKILKIICQQIQRLCNLPLKKKCNLFLFFYPSNRTLFNTYSLKILWHFTVNKCLDSPSVNRGSGSFRKNVLSRLLITFRSCHLCEDMKRRL